MGISLLKAPEFPWEGTDKKNHTFIYSVMCHDKPLTQSNVFEEAYKLNTPLWAAIVKKPEVDGPLEDGTILFSPVSEVPPLSYFEMAGTPNCIISAFKRSEKNESKFIIRLSEMRGETCMSQIKFNLG